MVHITDIEWDTDGKDVELPKEGFFEGFANGYILKQADVEALTNELVERYGYDIKGLKYSCHDSD